MEQWKEEEQEFLNLCKKIQEEHPGFKTPTFTRKLKGVCAGWANATKNILKINKNLHGAEFTETLYHEMMHMLDWFIYKNAGHGRTWQLLMLAYGRVPKRCHNFDLKPARTVSRREVYCGCEKKSVTVTLYTKMQKGNEYRCRQCGKTISLQKENTIVKPEKT